MKTDPNGTPYVGLGLFFEEWVPGRRFRTVGRTITDTDITNFVSVTGMTEVLFTDLEYLRTESLLGGRPAPGALIYALSEGLLMQSVMQHTGMAFLGAEILVKAPVNSGDTIHVVCEVTEARRSVSRPDRGIVSAINAVTNQHGNVVLTYTAKRMVKALEAG